MNPTHGDWCDEWGACKACGGEIPHGHSNNCEIYRLQRIEDAAKAFIGKVEALTPAINAAFQFQQIHGIAYAGESWKAEFDALKLALVQG